MAESLRLVLIGLALAILVIAVVLELTGHGTSNAWTAFSAVLGMLTGQHLEKPTKSLMHGWND
jgi:hypothetical protein